MAVTIGRGAARLQSGPGHLAEIGSAILGQREDAFHARGGIVGRQDMPRSIVSYKILSCMIEIQETPTFSTWLHSLRDDRARARISVRIDRLRLGNAGDAKPVGIGVSELRVDYVPG